MQDWHNICPMVHFHPVGPLGIKQYMPYGTFPMWDPWGMTQYLSHGTFPPVEPLRNDTISAPWYICPCRTPGEWHNLSHGIHFPLWNPWGMTQYRSHGTFPPVGPLGNDNISPWYISPCGTPGELHNIYRMAHFLPVERLRNDTISVPWYISPCGTPGEWHMPHGTFPPCETPGEWHNICPMVHSPCGTPVEWQYLLHGTFPPVRPLGRGAVSGTGIRPCVKFQPNPFGSFVGEAYRIDGQKRNVARYRLHMGR